MEDGGKQRDQLGGGLSLQELHPIGSGLQGLQILNDAALLFTSGKRDWNILQVAQIKFRKAKPDLFPPPVSAFATSQLKLAGRARLKESC